MLTVNALGPLKFATLLWQPTVLRRRFAKGLRYFWSYNDALFTGRMISTALTAPVAAPQDII